MKTESLRIQKIWHKEQNVSLHNSVDFCFHVPAEAERQTQIAQLKQRDLPL